MPSIPELTKIKELRRKLNLTQKDLEEVLHIPQSTLSRIESGKGNPSYHVVKKIFDYLEEYSLKKKNSEILAENIMTTNIISISSKSTIKQAIELMNKHQISQLPIIENDQNIGSITSKKIQKLITDNPTLINANVLLIKELPFPEVDMNWKASNISNLLSSYPAVLVKKGNHYVGIITDADLLKLAFNLE
ncbi:MAG: CBS domain-containing protein [Promethearchaeota archaeon]